MAATPSTMLPLGTPAPRFALPDAATGRTVSIDEYANKPLLVMFICNHCPFVIHVRDELTRLAGAYLERGIGIVGINANSEKTHPQDGPPHMKELAQQLGWRFPFLFDASQAVAKAYTAACTPDDSRPSNGLPVTGADLRAALDAIVSGRAPAAQQKPSIGCNIKWSPGNEPPYFG
jgi:peroxiredoxin